MPISTRVLTVITIVLLVAVAVGVVVAYLVTRQPPLVPVTIPSTSVA